MSKLTIAPINSGYRSAEALTENFEAIAEAVENTLSRDGTGPNQMEADLDMNSNRIINLPEPNDSSEPARLADLEAIDLAAADLAAIVETARQTLGVPVEVAFYGGSVGASAATNDTAFASIAAGSIVDLHGGTYTVTSATTILARLQPYNGALKVGSARYPMSRNPRAHPLDSASPKIIEEGQQVHYWPGTVANYSGTYVGCWVQAKRHEVTPGAPLVFERSKDGVSWKDAVVIYSHPSYEPRALVGCKVSASRFGVLFIVQDEAGTIQGTYFAYTDNPTAQKPTFTIVDCGTTIAYWHPEPIIEGANLHFFGYGGSPDYDIHRLTSTNSGAAASWSATKIIEGSTAAIGKPAEPAVVKIDANKYLMIVRDDDGGNAYASTSTDLSTWTPLVDTGIDLGLNPPAAICTWGKVYFYAAARSDSVDSLTDTLIVYEADANAVYNAGGSFSPVPPPRIVMKGKPSMVGYLATTEIDPGWWMGIMIDGEDELGSSGPTTSRLLRLGGYEVPSQVNLVHRRRPPITKANTPIWWPYGDVTGITSRAKSWGGSWLASSSQSISATKTQLSDTVRGAIPWSPPYAARLQSAAGGSGRTIYSNRIYGRENVAVWLDKVVTGNLAGYGQLPGYLQLRIALSFGTGGSPSSAIIVDSAQAAISSFASGDGHKVVSVVSYTPRVTSSHTWGSNADTDAYLDFRWISNDTGEADFYLTGRWVDLGNEYVPLDPETIDEVREALKSQTELITIGPSALLDGTANFGSSSSGASHLSYAEKRTTPAVSLATGVAASDFLQNGSVACTGVSFDLIGRRSCRIVYADSGAGFSTSVQEVRTSSNGVEILVEAIS